MQPVCIEPDVLLSSMVLIRAAVSPQTKQSEHVAENPPDRVYV